MARNRTSFSRRYARLLHTYVQSPDEKYLAEIEHLGQEMVLSGIPPEDVGEMHDLAIAELIEAKIMGAGHIRAVSLPLMQLLMAYGVAFRALQEKKETEARLHLASRAIANTAEGIIITDDQGIIVDVNNAFERLTGYTKAEAVGNSPSMLHSGKQDADFYIQMWNKLTETGQWKGQIWNKRKNGEVYPEYLSITAIHDDTGKISNYIGVFSDITEQLSLEQQFLQAQKMEAIGTMVGGIAHDFNNILAGMTGYLYLAKQQMQVQPDVTQMLGRVEALSRRAADMIQQLLTFARKGMVNMKAFPLTPFIKEALQFLHAAVPENILMHEDICNEPLQIIGDTTQLHQLLMNLVNNARDALEGVDEEPTISIRLAPFYADDAFLESHADVEARAYAHLSVEDNGCGIPADQLEHIFEPFFTTKEVGKGTGLGLSMIYGAVKTHHGIIDVDSKPGEGSVFHLYVPLLAQDEDVADSEQEAESSEGHGELILLADDEQVVRDTMVEILQSLGYKVLSARDGREAMALFNDHQQDFALAILDVVMPHCGGVSLARQIRAGDPDFPIIFLTGYAKEHVLDHEKALANINTLTKPVNFDLLSQQIRQMLA